MRRAPVTSILLLLLVIVHLVAGPATAAPGGLLAHLGGALRHGGLGHLALNLVLLGVGGWQAEPALGTPRFAVLFGVSALVATLVEYAVAGPGFVGASGFAMGAAAYAVMAPAGIRERVVMAVLGAAALGLDALFNPIPIATLSHTAGAAVGTAWALVWPLQPRKPREVT